MLPYHPVCFADIIQSRPFLFNVVAQVNFNPDTQLSKSLTFSCSQKNAPGTQPACSSPPLASRAGQGKTKKTGRTPFSIHVKNWDVSLLFLAKI